MAEAISRTVASVVGWTAHGRIKD